MLQRKIPLFIVFVMGFLMTVQFYIPHPVSQTLYKYVLDWMNGVASMAIVLAVGSLIMHHWRRLKKPEFAPYSAVALVSLFFMAILGFFFGIGEGSLFQKMFENVQIPLQATMFSLLAFYMASAAYRAFRARNLEATLLLLSAFILMIGIIPLGYYIHPKISDFALWILNVPNLAAKRGIMIGVGLGMMATSLKIILGIERNWLGG
ncbi:MAG: hypothetical protein J7L74_03930 [Candidatus Hydrothermae bacterium]|uniref:Uncharacterized protein n=1 Tax=candidate division WOR-3 bacterium TaxID=2052148 RepID=A0A7C1BIY8_UNCW3|nr:hypothetical protein [Candidatus Hydrothermae bacterium]RKZ01907.1 MAG: hypothetical protein DRQ04_04295 [Candidatus Hydrothermae bacterium]HDM90153.1 hypothetical protein [candidate division WOR-3 bacterium]